MSAAHFIVRKSTLDKRWDAFYSTPEIVALEHRVQQKATHTLRDFVQFMSGGATPLKSEGDQHYTDAANGVPFIRVQNLTTTGKLDLQDVKYITHSTNNSSLARSRLSGGELLVKITGVGRMAVASVVPDGLEANINQHIAAITTESKAQSEALAAYLNLDFVERLASRRATGGTRPALDYSALLSIPVIDDSRIVSIMQDAYAEKRKLEAQATKLLASVDEAMYAHLGMEYVNRNTSSLTDRIFRARMSELNSSVFNPKTYMPISRKLVMAIKKGKYPITGLYKLIVGRCAGDWGEDVDYQSEIPNQYRKCLVIRGTEFDNEFNLRIASGREKYRMIAALRLNKMAIEEGDILIEKSGGSEDQPVGRVALIETDLLVKHTIGYSNFVEKIKPNKQIVHPAYLFNYLKFLHSIGVTDLIQSQTNGIRNLMMQKYLDLPVAVPIMARQLEIVANIDCLRNEAIALRATANEKLQQAKQVVGNLILGEG